MKQTKIFLICMIIFLLTTFFCGCGEESKSNKDNNDSTLIIEEGDCVDLHFIGMYSSNNTVFDSSYDDVDSKTGGSPLNVYIDFNGERYSENYTSEKIPLGLLEGLIGLKEGETYTIGPIPPKKAYGQKKLSVGDAFYSKNFALNTINPELSLNQTLEVTQLTESNLSLKWVGLDDYGQFTMPQIVLNDLLAQMQEDMILIPPSHFIWENASEIIDYDDETVTIKTTPTKTETLYDYFEQVQYGFGQNDVFSIFPDATNATYNETTITLKSNPEVGSEYEYSYSYFGQEIVMTYTVKNMTEDTIGLSIVTQGADETQNQTVARTLEFGRTYEFPRTYENIPSDYQEELIGEDLEKQGYGISDLAGESLTYQVTIIKIDKTSQK